MLNNFSRKGFIAGVTCHLVRKRSSKRGNIRLRFLLSVLIRPHIEQYLCKSKKQQYSCKDVHLQGFSLVSSRFIFNDNVFCSYLALGKGLPNIQFTIIIFSDVYYFILLKEMDLQKTKVTTNNILSGSFW